MSNVKHIDHLNITVHSFAETAAWYGRVFGFEIVEKGDSEKWGPWGVLRSGDAMLCIYERPEHRFEDVRAQGIHGVAHFGLRVSDRAEWEATIERESVTVSYGGPINNPHSTAWYVNDPTGWEIEVTYWNNDTIAFTNEPVT